MGREEKHCGKRYVKDQHDDRDKTGMTRECDGEGREAWWETLDAEPPRWRATEDKMEGYMQKDVIIVGTKRVRRR